MSQEQALPNWDMSNVFPGLESPELSKAIKALESQINDLEAYLNEHRIDPDLPPETHTQETLAETITGLLGKLSAAQENRGTIGAYLHAFISTDSFN